MSTNKIGGLIAPIDYSSINIKAQPTAAGKKEVIKRTPSGKKEEATKKYTYQGKTYTESQLMNAAKQSGMTLEEYKKALKL